MDVAVLNNRLRATMEYFIKTNDGMFITTSYPAVLGAADIVFHLPDLVIPIQGYFPTFGT